MGVGELFPRLRLRERKSERETLKLFLLNGRKRRNGPSPRIVLSPSTVLF